MPDWTRGYQETFEFWKVDPYTMADVSPLRSVTACDITRDAETDKIESARISLDEDISEEAYIRCYLSVTQDGTTERVCLGTWLAQSPTAEYDGKTITRTVECLSPLQELSDDMPPVGYSVKDVKALAAAYDLASSHVRGNVVQPRDGALVTEAFVADDGDTWLSFVADLAAKDRHHLTLDPYGDIGFAPDTNGSALAPVWEYDDGNASILEAEVTDEADWYGIPNVVEVIVSTDTGSIVGRAENDDENSMVSTASRGRTVLKRVTDAQLADNPTQDDVDAYARKVLRESSQIERRITYTHAYNGVKLGDGVALRYTRHGLNVSRAKVVRQEMSCGTGMTVKETAVYTETLWNGD